MRGGGSQVWAVSTEKAVVSAVYCPFSVYLIKRRTEKLETVNHRGWTNCIGDGRELERCDGTGRCSDGTSAGTDSAAWGRPNVTRITMHRRGIT
jgi:hypothetical protein